MIQSKLAIILATVGCLFSVGCAHQREHSVVRMWGDYNSLRRPSLNFETVSHKPHRAARVGGFLHGYGQNPGHQHVYRNRRLAERQAAEDEARRRLEEAFIVPDEQRLAATTPEGKKQKMPMVSEPASIASPVSPATPPPVPPAPKESTVEERPIAPPVEETTTPDTRLSPDETLEQLPPLPEVEPIPDVENEADNFISPEEMDELEAEVPNIPDGELETPENEFVPDFGPQPVIESGPQPGIESESGPVVAPLPSDGQGPSASNERSSSDPVFEGNNLDGGPTSLDGWQPTFDDDEPIAEDENPSRISRTGFFSRMVPRWMRRNRGEQ